MINLTDIARLSMYPRIKAAKSWEVTTPRVQRHQLDYLLKQGRQTKWGEAHGLERIKSYEEFARQIPIVDYEAIRMDVMRMISGEADVLWPGVTRRFAQSSGTTGGKSKYIPVTNASLKHNHYAGSRDVVAHYLHLYPNSRMFAGKGFILGGSYANELNLPSGVKVGDLSANLIDNIQPIVNRFRVPSKDIALMEDWRFKLPALVQAAGGENVTNISGVPSWFLTVLKAIIATHGATTIHDVWPNLEVFFHGGISFKPYRDEYHRITDPARMLYIETYNASEGFFATQNAIDDPAMLLLMDVGVFYEFLPLDAIDDPNARAIPAWCVEPGNTYALIITACNGLWRYMIGDTVKIERINPLKITIAGRTKSFINVFGEEVMVHNTDAALAKACKRLDCTAVDYTAGPVMPSPTNKGRHHWMIEWGIAPKDIMEFEHELDHCLQQENSDYQAKRTGDLFLDCLTVETVRPGVFDAWLASTGKLGGQRKVPRLSNDRSILNQISKINNGL